jgi:hypothetical protein
MMPRSLLSLLFLLTLLPLQAACGFFGGNNEDTPQPSATNRIPIIIDQPGSGATVSSPFTMLGSVAANLSDARIDYRLFDAQERLLAGGTVEINPESNEAVIFSLNISYTLETSVNGRLEVVAIDPNAGVVLAIASTPLNLVAGVGQTPDGDTPGEPFSGITIETPAPGTIVGSPVVITGRATLSDGNNELNYRILDDAGNPLGEGSVAIAEDGGFVASIDFALPEAGGPITAEIYESDGTAKASVGLQVAPPQSITIETPPTGTTVGSPVVITGRLARAPAQGSLEYRFSDGDGRELGTGSFVVGGAPGEPTSFSASLDFSLPLNGGPISIEVIDRDPTTDTVIARTSRTLNVNPQPQSIVIESPPTDTLVGSPLVITGRTVRYPSGGQLGYRIRDANGQEIGNGSFSVTGSQERGATFNTTLSFTLPIAGGPIIVEILELDQNSSQVRASTTLRLQVAPQS